MKSSSNSTAVQEAWRRSVVARVGFALLGAALVASAGCFFTLADVKRAADPDAGGSDDGGLGGADGLAPPEDWCDAHAPNATFCRDFDTDTNTGWHTFAVDSGTQIAAITTEDYASPPRSWHFGVTAFPPSQVYNDSQCDYAAPTAVAHASIAFDLKIAQLAAGHGPALIYFGTSKPTNSLRVEFKSADGTNTVTTAYDENASFSTQWSDSPQVGVWTRIFLELTLGSLSHVKVSLGDPGSTTPNGAPVAESDLPAAWGPGTPFFALGVPFTSSVGDAVFIDDVVYDGH